MSEGYLNSKSWHGRPSSHRSRGEAGRSPGGATKVKPAVVEIQFSKLPPAQRSPVPFAQQKRDPFTPQ